MVFCRIVVGLLLGVLLSSLPQVRAACTVANAVYVAGKPTIGRTGCTGCAAGYKAQLCTAISCTPKVLTCTSSVAGYTKLLCVACGSGSWSPGGLCGCTACACPPAPPCYTTQTCSSTTGLCPFSRVVDGTACTTAAGEQGTCTAGKCEPSEVTFKLYYKLCCNGLDPAPPPELLLELQSAIAVSLHEAAPEAPVPSVTVTPFNPSPYGRRHLSNSQVFTEAIVRAARAVAQKVQEYAASESCTAAVADRLSLSAAMQEGNYIQRSNQYGLLSGLMHQVWQADVVVYGGGFGGIAAALSADATLTRLGSSPPARPRVVLMKTNSRLGDLGTVGGQNYYDIKVWPMDVTPDAPPITPFQPQQGTQMKIFCGFDVCGVPFPRDNTTCPGRNRNQCYATTPKAAELEAQVAARKPGLLVYSAKEFGLGDGPVELAPDSVKFLADGVMSYVGVVPLKQPTDVRDPWEPMSNVAPKRLAAKVFVDASEHGRMTYMAALSRSIPFSVGRQGRYPTQGQERIIIPGRRLGLYKLTQGPPCATSNTPDLYLTDCGSNCASNELGTSSVVMDMAKGRRPSSCLTTDKACYVYVTASDGVTTHEGWVEYSSHCANIGSTPTITTNLDCPDYAWETRQCSVTDTRADGLQMVATLMFQVKGLTTNGDVCLWEFPGKALHSLSFNTEAYQSGAASPSNPGRFAFKRPNVALNEGGAGDPTASWWVNGLIIFGVDGLCQRARFNTAASPVEKCPSAGSVVDGLTVWTAEEAYTEAVKLLVDASKISPLTDAGKQLKAAVRAVLGQNVVIVKPQFGTVGETLYLRETIHMGSSTPRQTPWGPSRSALSGREVFDAVDPRTVPRGHTVALGLYQMDSNGYRKMQVGPGLWAVPNFGAGGLVQTGSTLPMYGLGSDDNPSAYSDMRLIAGGTKRAKPEPWHPAAIPFEVMITDKVPNLLVCGYAVNMDPWAWTMLRVLPNPSVLGDAAGVAAAVAVFKDQHPATFDDTMIAKVREGIIERTDCSGAKYGVDGLLPPLDFVPAPPPPSTCPDKVFDESTCVENTGCLCTVTEFTPVTGSTGVCVGAESGIPTCLDCGNAGGKCPSPYECVAADIPYNELGLWRVCVKPAGK